MWRKFCSSLHLNLSRTLFDLGPPTMDSPIDRTIRLAAVAAGLVSLVVLVVFQIL